MTTNGDAGGLTRRRWLQIAGASSAVGAITTTSVDARAFSLLRSPEAPVADASIPSYCELCFWNCGLVAHVKGNQVLSLSGHPDYPTAQGRLCGRGNAGAGFVRDDDRLKYPMVRVGKRGEGKFRRVGWKTAYQTIARGFRQIIDEHGPESLALFYHGTGGPLLRTMLVGLGSPNFAGPSYAQCKGPRNVGYKLTFGEKLPSPEPLDFEHTQCMVLFGSHLGENAHNSQVQEFVRAQARGAKLVVLDPRYSTVASKSDVWLPVRPGSDTAIVLAWIRQLIVDEAYDASFVERHCTGFDELSQHVKSFTLPWAAQQAGVEVEDLKRAYDLIRAARPAVMIHPGRHVAWYGEADTQRARAQAILTALLGAWWNRGGIYRGAPPPTLQDYPGPDFPESKPHVDQAAKRYPFAQEVTTNGIREATLTGNPYPIKGWFVHGTNLIQSMPNVHQTVEAIEKLDMIVVCDIQPTEITNYADVLLPEDIYLERYDDLKRGGGKRPYIGLRQPVVRSPYDTRPAWRIAKELATELGVGDFFAYRDFEEYLAKRLEGSGVTLEELKQKGIHFTEPTRSRYLEPDEEVHWHTPSGKVELYSRQLDEAGFDPLPTFAPQPDPPDGFLRLLYGRSPLHTFGRTQNNEILFDIDPSNCLWMHPACAEKLGLSHQQPVLIENGHGDVTGPLPLRVTERLMPKTVYMVHGFGHRAPKLRNAHGTGGSDSILIDKYAVDPISGSTGMRTEFVKVRPADSNAEVFPCATG